MTAVPGRPARCMSRYRSPLGPLALAAEDGALVGLWFEGQRHFPASLAATILPVCALPVFRQAAAWLDAYFGGRLPGPVPPVRFEGTPFRRQVWEVLARIPYGSTATYKDVAQEVARLQGRASLAAQAVGGAVGHNPLCLLVPCHRVVGADGSLTGYAGGTGRKRWLLALEERVVRRLRPEWAPSS